MSWFKKLLPLSDQPPWMLELRSSEWFIVATITLSMFTDLFLYAMIVPVMPTALVERAGVAYDDREHWNSILLIAEAAAALVASPIFGYALDLTGTRQGLYLLGLILLAGSMAALTAAHSVAWYVIARVLQGAATAMVSVAGLSIITDSVEKKRLGQMLGYMGIGTTLGFMAGPLLGGVVYQEGGFYAVFGMAFGIVGLDLLLRLALVEKKTAARWLSSGREQAPEERSQAPNEDSSLRSDQQFDEKSLSHKDVSVSTFASTSASTSASALASESESDKSKPTDETVHESRDVSSSGNESTAEKPNESSIGHGSKDSAAETTEQGNNPATTIAQGKAEPKGKFALLKLLKQPRIWVIGWAVMVEAIVFSSFDAILPIFVEDTFHWNSMGQGLVFLPPCAACVFQPLFGWLADNFGARWLAFASWIGMAPCLICLRFIEENTLTHKAMLCLILGLVGFWIDLGTPALLVELQVVLDDMEEKEPGVFGENGAIAQAFSLEALAQFAGLAIGPLAGGFVGDSYGWKVMTLFLGILSGITAIPTLCLSGGRRVWPDDTSDTSEEA